MPTSPPQLAFVTLVTSDDYLPGALVVAAALKEAHPSPPIYPDEYDPSDFHRICLATPETLNVNTMKHLRRAFDVVIGVEVIEEDTEEGLKLLGRLDLRTVLTKLHVFRLTDYRKVIFLDADILPLRPLSHLFRISASFAAVPDVGWPDIFNSGFFVLEPSEEKFKHVMEVVKSKGSWDGGDQGVLNEWAGQNWERLSFIYNTTPTAVYTYAPAYKRFGSQINNIHFIGPNKPWTQLPLRPAGTSSERSPSTSPPSQEFGPPSSFGYHAMLDRWFAVYDKHYRSSSITSHNDSGSHDESFVTLTDPPSIPRYSSVWNSKVPPEAVADTSGAGGPLDLEELRRIAISGVGESATQGGEGIYRSLPLEGRIDLMSPPKPKPVSEEARSPPVIKTPPIVRIIVPEGPHTPVRAFTPMTTLPTPGPNELPPTPMFRRHSLPPETPTHVRPGTREMSYATPDHDHLLPRAQRLPQYSRASPPVSPRHSSTPPRYPSPPLVTWNPAVEAPPSVPPPALHFPADTYFPNVWDAQSHDHSAPEDNGGLFSVPPPPSIPETLVKEGHYQAVIGEPEHHEPLPQLNHGEQLQQPQLSLHPPSETQPSDEPPIYHPPSYPQPDRSKVAAVFPWEETPRHAPVRFFPRTDSPPPGLPFIQPQPPALKLNLRGSPVPVPPRLSLPPQQGFSRTTTYANAWDAVPSIQRYASRLVRPSQPATASWTPEPGAAKKGGGAALGVNEYRSWQDIEEISSRDADDEDEDDDENGLSLAGGKRGSEIRGDHPQERYHEKGVQTTPKQTRNQSVQVYPSASGKQVTWSTSSGLSKREYGDVNPDGSAHDQATHSPASSAQVRDASIGVTRRGPAHHTTLGVNASDIPNVPELSPTNARPSNIFTETLTARREVTSPSSSMGPLSPPEGAPVSYGTQLNAASVVRPAGRTFDPARDVDVFKKGSEEVLARFLNIGTWEDVAS